MKAMNTIIKYNRYKRDMYPVHMKQVDMANVQFNAESKKVSGYLSVFNVIDTDDDIILKGAYAKSIKERGPESKTNRKIAFLYQHDMRDPVGHFTLLKEDDFGLYFEAELDLGVPSADRVLIQLKSGTLNQFSIGFLYVTGKRTYDEKQKAWINKEINLFEGSVVTLGANEYTFFDGMKSNKMANKKQELLKETETFIKSLPTEFQYDARQIIAKNIQLAASKAIEGGDDGDDGESGDANLDFIHKNLALHGKGLAMIDDATDVDNDELQDCMKGLKDVHTKAMGDLCDIKDSITGEKSLREPRETKALPGKPIKDLSAALAETSFLNV